MKNVLSVLLSFMLVFLVACGDSTNAPATTAGESDFSGGWTQTNSNSKTAYQIAMIADGTIEVYWKSDDDTTSLYWAGTYVAPATTTNEYSWDSVNDKSRTSSALLASGDDTKTFTYKDGVISYSVSAMGNTTTVSLERSDAVNIQVEKAVSTSDFLPLELVDSGFAVKDGNNTYYVQYAVIMKNPNTERAVKFPKFRLTARDDDGSILGTDDIVGSSILPGESWYSAFQGLSVDSRPTTVDFEIIQPDDSDWVSPDSIDYAGEPLAVLNSTKREAKIVGEVSNPNDFDIDSVAVVVLFRDDNGKLLSGETTYTDQLPASGKIPFELSLWGADDGYVTENYEVYAYPW